MAVNKTESEKKQLLDITNKVVSACLYEGLELGKERFGGFWNKINSIIKNGGM